MGNASSFAQSYVTAKQRWRSGPFHRDHLANLSSLKLKFQRIVAEARNRQLRSNGNRQDAARKIQQLSRKHLATEGAQLYREALQAVGVDDDEEESESEKEFVKVPDGRHVQLQLWQFDDLIAALQTSDPEPTMRRLGLTPLDRVYTGKLKPRMLRLPSDFRREWGDVESIIDLARTWKWPSVPALESWVYVVS